MKKGIKIMLMVLMSIIVAIGAFLGVYFLWPWNSEFFDKANKEFEIPGLDTAFVPQGMTYVEGVNKFIISGYMSDGAPSRIYVVDEADNDNYYVTLKDGNSDYLGHAGGVEIYGNSLWIVSGDDGGHCYVLSLNELLNADNGNVLTINAKFETNNGADFIFKNDGLLWIGEFHKDGAYDTDDTHHLTTTSGEINKAVAFAYEIDESNIHGVSNLTPVKALSIRSLCQGIAVDDEGKFILSTSYSLPDSNIYYYEDVLDAGTNSTITVNGNVIPLWFLDDNSLISTTNAPSMSEELIVKDGKVYILFESACKKYRLFNRKKLWNVYSLDIDNDF